MDLHFTPFWPHLTLSEAKDKDKATERPGGAAVPSPHVCPSLGQAEAVAVEMDPIGHSIGRGFSILHF